MTPDLVAELLRQLMKEAMILAAPLADCGGPAEFLSEPGADPDQPAGAVADLGAAAGGGGADSAGRHALVSGPNGRLHAAAAGRSAPLPGLRAQRAAGQRMTTGMRDQQPEAESNDATGATFLSAMTLALVRVSGMVAFAPFFSSTALPMRAKAVLVPGRGLSAGSAGGHAAQCARGDRLSRRCWASWPWAWSTG